MGKEINLLINYPRTKRNLAERQKTKSAEDREIARRFDRDFFDGDRKHGYGGYNYVPRFWQPVVPTFVKYWGLNKKTSILDVGCAKGFMMHDILQAIPGIDIKGIDISNYAISNCLETVADRVQVANATNLPFEDNSFDVVISINTIHNLDKGDCGKALKEIERVSRSSSFITVDAYRTEDEKKRMEAWNLTAKTILSCEEWVKFFDNVDYTGDYFWFIP